jgi:hypothetical protein
MPSYLLHHRHEADKCGVALTAFRGHTSSLRHATAISSCPFGEHSIWWTVVAESERSAQALLPFYVAERTTVTQVSEIEIP